MNSAETKISVEDFRETAQKHCIMSSFVDYSQRIQQDLLSFSQNLQLKTEKNKQRIKNYQDSPRVNLFTQGNKEFKKYQKFTKKMESLSPICSTVFSWSKKQVLLGGYSYLYSCSEDFLEKASPVLRIRPSGPKAFIRCMAFHPCDKLIAFSSDVGVFDMYDIDLLFHLNTFTDQKAPITGLNFSSEGSKLISSSFDGSILVYDLIESKIARKVEISSGITSMVVSANDSEVIISKDNGKVAIFDNRDSCVAQMIDAHYGAINTMTINSDSLLSTGGTDGCLRVWDIRNSISSYECFSNHAGSVIGVSNGKDGIVYSLSSSGFLHCNSINDGKYSKLDIGDGALSLSYNMLSDYLIVTRQDRVLKVQFSLN